MAIFAPQRRRLFKGPSKRSIFKRNDSRPTFNPFEHEDTDKRYRSVHNVRSRKKHIPKVICLFGRRGEGKTLGVVAIARQLQRRYELAGLGKDFAIYSNFWVSFADKSRQTIVEELQEFPDWLDEKRYALLLIDEVAELLPSARAMSNNNLLTMSFLKQIRKRGVSVAMATQFPQEVSVGTLRQVDYFIRCRQRRGGRGIEMSWWDWPGNVTGKWGRKYWPPEPGTEDWKFFMHNTDVMWGSYHTEEIVAPHHSDVKENIRAKQEHTYSDDDRLSGVRGTADDPALQRALSPEQELAAALSVRIPAKIREILVGVTFPDGKAAVEDALSELQHYWAAPKLTVQGAAARLKQMGAHIDMDSAGDLFVVGLQG